MSAKRPHHGRECRLWQLNQPPSGIGLPPGTGTQAARVNAAPLEPAQAPRRPGSMRPHWNQWGQRPMVIVEAVDPDARVATAGSICARSVGFGQFGATMGRTGRPNLIHYAISDSTRMTGTDPHAPRGTAGRGPKWDRGPRAGHAGAARRCTTRHRRPWAQLKQMARKPVSPITVTSQIVRASRFDMVSLADSLRSSRNSVQALHGSRYCIPSTRFNSTGLDRGLGAGQLQ